MHISRKAKEALQNLGAQIRMARKRRVWTIADLAIKVGVTAPTIIALEKGVPTVSAGVFFSALWTLGMERELTELTVLKDEDGVKLMNSRLPEKVKAKKKRVINDF